MKIDEYMRFQWHEYLWIDRLLWHKCLWMNEDLITWTFMNEWSFNDMNVYEWTNFNDMFMNRSYFNDIDETLMTWSFMNRWHEFLCKVETSMTWMFMYGWSYNDMRDNDTNMVNWMRLQWHVHFKNYSQRWTKLSIVNSLISK